MAEYVTVGLIPMDVSTLVPMPAELSSSFSLFDEDDEDDDEDDEDDEDAVTLRFLVVCLAAVTGPSSK